MENKLYFDGDWVYDLETYPNIITFAFVKADMSEKKLFEISKRTNDLDALLDFFRYLKREDQRMVGFNSLSFDYPIVHWILEKAKKAKSDNTGLKLTCSQIYKYAMKVIDSHKGDDFGINVKVDDIIIPQLDLFKMCHYDNKAKMTSLKLLEFNMRLKEITDLPFTVGKILSSDEMDTLIDYNFKDVYATLDFYKLCHSAIAFRKDLTTKYGFDCTNLNDSKIGEKFFMRKLEAENPFAFYEPDINGKKVMKQTKRSQVVINDCLFGYLRFRTPQCKALLNWFKKQVISETNGVFSDIEEHNLGDLAKYTKMVVKKVKFSKKPTDDEVSSFLNEHPSGWIGEEKLKSMVILKDENGNNVTEEYVDDKGKTKTRNVKVNKVSYYGYYRIAETLNITIGGMQIDFGVGGLHGANSGHHKSSSTESIETIDVASMYPNIAISNRVFPEHLSESFCDSYEDFYNERKLYKKGTGENLAIKLGLNATYGNSNNKYSPFFDSKYTMSITINGQLTLLMLAERLVTDCDARLLMGNTDGIEYILSKDKVDLANNIIRRWEKLVGLQMEGDKYSDMYIRDVNNYIAVTECGKVKQKGAYEYKPQLSLDLTHLHKNHSALIIAMAVEEHLLGNVDYKEFIYNHKNPFDFMLRTKVPRNCKLVLDVNGVDIEQQNICRYYPSNSGGYLVKIMPPLPDKTEDRRLSIESGVMVKTCNNMDDFAWDINYEYYFDQVERLLEPLGVAY